VVWPDSGGSPSKFEPQPSWQAAFVPSGVTTRDVVDIAYDGDPNSGAEVVVNSKGKTSQIGGTSLSAPLFAGAWARVLQQYPTIGFAGPVIYALPTTAFHDITSGNNNGETAKAGYDSVSGRGSVIVSAAVTGAAGHGNQPPTANFSYIANGLTVNFTDSSTDPDDGVFSHLWGFGDHTASSTTANPSHTYAAAGSYTVTETVKDQVGASSTKSTVVKVTSATQLLKNTGFETGVATPTPAAGMPISDRGPGRTPTPCRSR
jgi:PKD repeat protein